MVDAIITVLVEVAKCLASPAVRQFNYLRNYTSNLENLKTDFEILKGDSASTDHMVAEAKGNGEVIEMKVEKWLESVNKIITEADEFVGGEATADKHCFKGLCPNLKTRYRLSKEAVRLKKAIVELREARSFDRISYRTSPEDIRLLSSKDYYAFESRMSTLNNVLSALKDPDVYIVGICGMGGIGKATLAKEVARQAKSEKLFDQVVFVEVSLSPDIRKIQGEIADTLAHKLTAESEPGRASSLFRCIKEKEKILVILDNVWEKLELRDVGIPHGDDHKGCKILLTARSRDVLSNKMDSKQNFSVGILNEEEAWSLFKKMAGDYIEGSQFKSVATDVAKKCAGLPVSIVTVARALRNERSLDEWKDSLKQLRTPSSTNYKDIQAAAYSAIELSYNKLKGEELKKIFLLIGYAHLQSVDALLNYGMGLGLFEDINNMEEAQARVRTLVLKLKASCMLHDYQINWLIMYDVSQDEFFSMHDVVRDVAVSIASRAKNVHVATGELVNGWESAVKFNTSIVLLDVKTNVFAEVLECHQLQLIDIRAEYYHSPSLTIPDNFFMSMVQVRVINLSNMHLLSLPSSLGLLTNLRTLRLYECELQDITVVGELKNLEILSLEGSTIKQLPVEVGQLILLRSLDLRDCGNVQVIPPNVLSKLSHLEELYIGRFSFDEWEEEVEGVKNASLNELKDLRNLTTLELCIKDVNILPRGLFFEKLERYDINIGALDHSGARDYTRTFLLELNTNNCLKDGLIVQLQGIESLSLEGLQEQDIKYLVDELLRVGSLQLKHFMLDNRRSESKRQDESTTDKQSSEIIFEDNALFMDKVSFQKLETLELGNVNVERIWQSRLATMSCGFQNLTRLSVYGCMNLRCIFQTSTVVSSFNRLQSLEIEKCPKLEEIIVVDQEERKNNILVFPELQYLKMKDLKKLKCFSTGDVLLSNLETLELHYVNFERIWQNLLAAGIQNLTRLEVCGCWNLRCLFQSSVVNCFVQLRYLHVEKCPELKEIMVVDQEEKKKNNIIVFPELQFLRMKDLEKLKYFSTGDVQIEFPSLKELILRECPCLSLDLTKEVFVFSNLEVLRAHAKCIPWIFQFPEDVLGKLKCLDVTLDKLTTISSLDDFFQRFHSIKFLVIIGGDIEYFSGLNENGMKAIVREFNNFCDLIHILKHGTILENLETLHIQDLGCDNLINLAPSLTTFQNLTTLIVETCNGLRNVLTASIAKCLVQLKQMKIGFCIMITEIVADDLGDEIIFSELKMLDLYHLPRLTSFCSGNCAFKFPSLEILMVKDCPQMKIFSGGELSTSNLHKIQTERYYKGFDWTWKGDVNTTIQQLFTEEAMEADKEENDKSIRDNKHEGSHSQVSKEDLGQTSMQHLE